MHYYYKITDKNGVVVGLGVGETPMTNAEMCDELYGYIYTEISESEYLRLSENN